MPPLLFLNLIDFKTIIGIKELFLLVSVLILQAHSWSAGDVRLRLTYLVEIVIKTSIRLVHHCVGTGQGVV